MDPSIPAYRTALARALHAIDDVYELRVGVRPAATQDDLDEIAFLDSHLYDRLRRCTALLEHIPGYVAPEQGADPLL